MRKSRLIGGSVLVATAMVGFMLVPAAPATAAPGVDQWQHFVDCLGWMFNSPAKHAAECAPGHEYFIPWQNATTTVTPPAPSSSFSSSFSSSIN